VVRNGRKTGSTPEGYVLPEWGIDLIRKTGRELSKLLWRITYTGTENIPRAGGIIIAANHQTYIDPFWVGFAIQRPLRYLAWNEAFDWPIAGKFMGLLGAWPLEVEKSDPTAIRRTLGWLKDGGAVVIFPEGGRGNPDGSLVKFKNGAVRMAMEANVPVMPVTIRGAHKVWPKGYTFPRFARVEVVYHPPYHIIPAGGEDTRACARRESERLAAIISSAL
jgi:1-acyl-sn-glycerol-3-phosphate acyltransferase